MYVLKILTTRRNSIGLARSNTVALGNIQQSQPLIVGFVPGVVSGRLERDFDPDARAGTRRISAGPGNNVTAEVTDGYQLDVMGCMAPRFAALGTICTRCFKGFRPDSPSLLRFLGRLLVMTGLYAPIVQCYLNLCYDYIVIILNRYKPEGW